MQNKYKTENLVSKSVKGLCVDLGAGKHTGTHSPKKKATNLDAVLVNVLATTVSLRWPQTWMLLLAVTILMVINSVLCKLLQSYFYSANKKKNQ